MDEITRIEQFKYIVELIYLALYDNKGIYVIEFNDSHKATLISDIVKDVLNILSLNYKCYKSVVEYEYKYEIVDYGSIEFKLVNKKIENKFGFEYYGYE